MLTASSCALPSCPLAAANSQNWRPAQFSPLSGTSLPYTGNQEVTWISENKKNRFKTKTDLFGAAEKATCIVGQLLQVEVHFFDLCEKERSLKRRG
jgi:hypothetical protein